MNTDLSVLQLQRLLIKSINTPLFCTFTEHHHSVITLESRQQSFGGTLLVFPLYYFENTQDKMNLFNQSNV